MAPCKPTNINKRAYPGNGSVIGPTTQPTCCQTSTTCCSFVCTLCGGSTTTTWPLGCRCILTSTPCCHCCCCCTCTENTRTIPSGMWKSSEQWDAKKRDAWSPTTGSSTTPIGFTAANGTLVVSSVDCYGFLICDAAQKWLVAPSSTQVTRTWYCRNDAVTTASAVGGSGWFVPSLVQLQVPGYTCRTYWDSYSAFGYWTSSEATSSYACFVRFNGGSNTFGKSFGFYVRAFRTV